IHTDLARNISIPLLINMMVGREIKDQITRNYRTSSTEIKFQVDNLTLFSKADKKKKLVDGMSFQIHPGEVLGIAGLRGSGASEMMMSIFGGYGTSGAENTVLNGKKIIVKKPMDAINHGIALLTNDRKV